MSSADVKAGSSGEAAKTAGGLQAGADEGTMGRLAGFLESQKSEFLADLKDGKGKGWVMVMGNEAGGMSI